MMTDFTRRDLIAAPALLALATRSAAIGPRDPFTLGVASGDPWPDGMVLWTRLAPDPLTSDGGMPARPVPVRWELAADPQFRRLLRHGTAIAEPAWGHSVHVELTGLLPGRPYWYRFIAGGAVSPVGRTRTAPTPGAKVDRARFCYGSCQKWEVGYYSAYHHMVAEDPDMILFLGDYIYEGAPEKGQVRLHANPEPKDVPGYRVRYAQYKTDPLLQAAHAAAPWVTTWDDHEVANDYADDLDEKNSDPMAFLKRRAAAYHVYYEHLPLRAHARPAPDGLTTLYRTIDWGGLAQFQVVDDRQFRSHRACQPPELIAAHKQYQVYVPDCPEIHDPRRTMLGSAQEAWLNGKLGSSRARWNLLTQQTLMTTLKRVDPDHPKSPEPVYSGDTWSTYQPARDRILQRWADARTPNPIALGGDIHSFFAGDMRLSPDGPPIAAEFVGGSITSLFHDPYLKLEAARSGGTYSENEVRGYGRVDLTPEVAEITFRGVRDATKPMSDIFDVKRFTVEAGRPGIAETA
ncbi:alkaline phosphatase D [Sphingomonas vulcanisoli]|uniref:Alkaline phosphatase D n=1 Tax=Sphingomonas vulcanisoli TaxID=1658060 RepID=A0ABX0TW70_9SPHN|nr:alkaline phosphatase D family protein [Sphingomonas vulcanisoli]NIJ08954.1 alkaline phosphatase D [Sphingomonas vulcanisoli]